MSVKYRKIEDYLIFLLSKRKFTFSFAELTELFDNSEQAIRRTLLRLQNKNQILTIRKDFYAILPPEYALNNTTPFFLVLDDLMKFLHTDYYLALYSAAAMYGAAHQQAMEFQVITSRQMQNMNLPNTKIRFYTNKQWDREGIVQKKSQAGFFNVSSPELTALDFMHYSGKIGGINRIESILSDLIEEIKPSKMKKTAESYPHTAALQRLGYLFDTFYENEKLANSIYKTLKNRNLHNTLLSNITPKKNNIDKKWKIDINYEIEREI
jgi:predicted transcriptional regulator of viral defense system